MSVSDSSSESYSEHDFDDDNFNADDICNNCHKYNCRCVHDTKNPYAIDLDTARWVGGQFWPEPSDFDNTGNIKKSSWNAPGYRLEDYPNNLAHRTELANYKNQMNPNNYREGADLRYDPNKFTKNPLVRMVQYGNGPVFLQNNPYNHNPYVQKPLALPQPAPTQNAAAANIKSAVENAAASKLQAAVRRTDTIPASTRIEWHRKNASQPPPAPPLIDVGKGNIPANSNTVQYGNNRWFVAKDTRNHSKIVSDARGGSHTIQGKLDVRPEHIHKHVVTPHNQSRVPRIDGYWSNGGIGRFDQFNYNSPYWRPYMYPSNIEPSAEVHRWVQHSRRSPGDHFLPAGSTHIHTWPETSEPYLQPAPLYWPNYYPPQSLAP